MCNQCTTEQLPEDHSGCKQCKECWPQYQCYWGKQENCNQHKIKYFLFNYMLLVQPVLVLFLLRFPLQQVPVLLERTRTTSRKRCKECTKLSVAVFDKYTLQIFDKYAFKVLAWNKKSRYEAHRGKVCGAFSVSRVNGSCSKCRMHCDLSPYRIAGCTKLKI